MKTSQRNTTQRDPEGITTDRVQFWSHTGTLIGMVSRDTARRLVGMGASYVITDQAIGQCEE